MFLPSRNHVFYKQTTRRVGGIVRVLLLSVVRPRRTLGGATEFFSQNGYLRGRRDPEPDMVGMNRQNGDEDAVANDNCFTGLAG